MKYKKHIPIYFAVDDNYVDYLKIVIASLIDHASKENKYEITIIYDKLSCNSKKTLKALAKPNVSVRFYCISLKMQSLALKLDVRDYYTLTTYYRILLPELFPLVKKALYLDCDIAILDDIANLYDIDIGNNLVGAIPDHSVQIYDEFIKYVETIIGVDHTRYFNAGILIMNFEEMRKTHFERNAFSLMRKLTFKVAQDQDVLNYLCKDKTFLLPKEWNVMPLGEKIDNPKLIHYNLIFKPWKHENIMYENYFWEYAKMIGLEEKLLEQRNAIPQCAKEQDFKGVDKVKELCLFEITRKDTYYKKLNQVKAPKKERWTFDEIKYKDVKPERKEILKKIEQYEYEGTFDKDVENDPPYMPLEPGTVDYLQKKWISKVKSAYANYYSFKFFLHQIKKGKIVIDGYEGIENLKAVKSGAIITANHFSPFDSIPIHIACKKYAHSHKLYKVIKEGNYSYPGIYGHFMRHCNTLPLASNLDVLKDFLKSVDIILKRGDFILVYAEQSMWWNYRKPKPLKPGAFKFAAKNNVPVIPTFITMRDTDALDEDGLPIQAYTLHILPAIYPLQDKSISENVAYLKEENEKVWKEVYEKVYGPLTYATKG